MMGWLLLKNMAMVPEGRSFPCGSENKPWCWLLDLRPPWFLPCLVYCIFSFSFIGSHLLVIHWLYLIILGSKQDTVACFPLGI